MPKLNHGALPSVMNHSFSRVPGPQIQRSVFNRSHGFKTTFDGGYLVPFFVDEALPGDTLNLRATLFARLATPLTPFMDNLYAETFFFAVPYRLLWSNWEKMNGEQTDPGDSTDFLVPVMTAPAVTGYAIGSLSDYFGIPTGIASLQHTSLWHRAYNLIYNEWFRDQNLQDSVVVDTDDGPDTNTDYVLLRRGKRHDYFTSCLPWPQKGTEVSIPLGTTAPVSGIGVLNRSYPSAPTVYETDGTSTVNYSFAKLVDGTTNDRSIYVKGDASSNGKLQIFADLSSATAATINQLREAFQIQRLYERDARGGTRYTEIIRAHFGVVSPDSRLQRPEFLGGGRTPITLVPIAQTSEEGTTPQGNLAAVGSFTLGSHGFVRSFTEHCVLIGLVNVRADLNYQQGLNRMFSRRSRWDFYWPALAHLGEQAVLNKEIYADASANDDLVFGYQERFAEYRYKPSVITGLFRSNAAGTLDAWHLAQDFASLPVLNASFIVDEPPIDRVIAVPAEPHFLFDAYFDYKCARPMPTFSVPGLIDHF